MSKWEPQVDLEFTQEELATSGEVAIVYKYHYSIYHSSGFGQGLRAKLSPANRRTLLTAAASAKELDMSIEDYVKAQFWWFDKAFGRVPKLNELASLDSKVNSIVRAMEYKEKVLKKEINASRNIISRASAAPSVDDAQQLVNERCERSLHDMKRAYKKTEEEIFRCFRGESLVLFFDRIWLNQNETYKRLKAVGEIK